MKRSYAQLRLYHALIKQLKGLDCVKVQLGTKEWRGDLKRIKNSRYLLKALDLELHITNTNYPQDPNKIVFCDANMEHLTHHISWLREVVWDNGLVPITEKGIYENE